MKDIGKNFNQKRRVVIQRVCVLGCLCWVVSGALFAAPELLALPKVSKVWVGAEKAMVTAAHYQEFYASSDSEILFLAEDGERIEKNKHWATLNPENLKLEKESFELEKQKNELKLMDFDEQEDGVVAGVRKSLSELEEKANDIALLSTQRNLGPKIQKKIQLAQKKILEQQLKLQEKLTPERRTQKTTLKKDELDLAIRKKRKFLDDLIRSSELRAPFSGELSLIVELDPKKREEGVRVAANTHYASITDNERFSIEVSPSALNQFNGSLDDLEIMMAPDGDGFALYGNFDRLEKVRTGMKSTEKWVFLVIKEHTAQAEKSMGVTRLAHIFKKLPQPSYMVMKKDLFSENPEVLKKKGWPGLVKYLWPEAKIVFIGPQSIALLPRAAKNSTDGH